METPDAGPPPPVVENVFGPMGTARAVDRAEYQSSSDHGALLVAQRRAGVGPQFNVVVCRRCHSSPTLGGSAERAQQTRLVRQQVGSSQLFAGINGTQTSYNAPAAEVSPRTPTPISANLQARRNPLPLYGLGLLAEVTVDEIGRHADPDDRDGDGISGRLNFEFGLLARFGWKAQTSYIERMVRGQLLEHMGITTEPLDEALRATLPARVAMAHTMSLEGGSVGAARAAQIADPNRPTTDIDTVDDPEMTPQELFDIVTWSMTLAAPQPDPLNESGNRGRATFERIGCASCHLPTLVSPRGSVPAYTDLLLHDMGPGLADGIVAGLASGSEFRTPPLWGVAARRALLHDGRADDLDTAIRAHGGEAQVARDAYVASNQADRSDLLEFLMSLGGREHARRTSLPDDAPLPAAGATGAPRDGADLDRFAAGRRLFDRAFGIEEGVGPALVADSCRGCHGLTPADGARDWDTMVFRQGILSGSTFAPPTAGILLARDSLVGPRPEPSSDATFVSGRLPPALWGAGLLEEVGVAGRGAFGWKGTFSTIEEAVRACGSRYMGLTFPPGPEGETSDDDDAPDPEIDDAGLADLVYYVSELDRPGLGAGPDPMPLGASIFSDLGCDGCHSPELGAGAATIAPYTDLQLHDVGDGTLRSVAEGDADWREFRTPALWGLGERTPLWHDGSAPTIDDAIRHHHGEADAPRAAYEDLSEADRATLTSWLADL